jgi:hypothetical protein
MRLPDGGCQNGFSRQDDSNAIPVAETDGISATYNDAHVTLEIGSIR